MYSSAAGTQRATGPKSFSLSSPVLEIYISPLSRWDAGGDERFYLYLQLGKRLLNEVPCLFGQLNSRRIFQLVEKEVLISVCQQLLMFLLLRCVCFLLGVSN